MENIKTVLVIINILMAIIINIGIVLKLRAYIINRKNNNVTGDNWISWEKMPFMERHHIRERLGYGDRHRMPKAPIRHEIKYWIIGTIFPILYTAFSLYLGFGVENIGVLIYIYAIAGLIFDRLNRKKRTSFYTYVRIVLTFVPIAPLFVQYPNPLFILKSSSISEVFTRWIPIAILLIILLIALVRRKLITVLFMIQCAIYVALSYLFKDKINYMPVTMLASFYCMMFIFTIIYNKKALKKVRVII